MPSHLWSHPVYYHRKRSFYPIINQLSFVNRSSSKQPSIKVSARYPCECVCYCINCHVCFITDQSNRSHLWCSASSFQAVKCAFYPPRSFEEWQITSSFKWCTKSTIVEIELQYSSLCLLRTSWVRAMGEMLFH